MTDKLPLYEMVHEWSFQKWDRLIDLGHGDRKTAEFNATRYRTWLRQAHRFVFEPDFVETLVHLARDMRRLPLWVQLARLPYDHVWIEWSIGVENKAQKDTLVLSYDEEIDGRDEPIGFLLVRDPRSQTKWMAIEFVIYDGRPMPSMTAMIFDPEGSAIEPVRGAFGMPTLSVDPMLKGEIAPGTENAAFMIQRQPDSHRIGIPQADWYNHKIGVVVEPLWRGIFSTPRFKAEKGKNPVARHIETSLIDEAGTLRKLTTALAMLNDVPTLGRTETKRGGMRSIRLKQLPYLGHTSVTLNLPKRANPVRTLQRYLNRAAVERAQMRAHEVRGHFRRISRKHKGMVCQHAAMNIVDGIGECARCGEQVRWITPFQRGDASLGFVQKTDYRIKSAE